MERKNTHTDKNAEWEIEALKKLLAEQQETLERDRKSLNDTMQKLEKMKVKTIVPNEVTVNLSRKLGPMDDVLFNKLGESKEAIGEVISTVLGIPVIVRYVIPQYTITGIGHRGVRLDSFSAVVPILNPLPQTLMKGFTSIWR